MIKAHASFIGLLLVLGFQAARASNHTAAAAAECTAVDSNIFPCAPYLIAGGDRPEPACCGGFMRMMLTHASCICSMFVEAKENGLRINITRVEALPEACGVPLSPVISKCKVALAPARSPIPQSPPPTSASPPRPTKPSTPTPSPAARSRSSAATPLCLLFTVIGFINFCVI